MGIAETSPTLSAALAAHAAARPASPALSAGEEELAYADLAEMVRALAGRHAHLGARPGDRVVLLGRNSIEWVAAFLACLDAGVVAVPLNPRLSPAEIAEQVRRVAPRLVLAGEGLEDAGAAAAEAAGAALRTLERGSGPRSIWNERSAAVVPPPPPPDAPALISFTSGSTGAPKGVVVTHGALAHAAWAGVRAVGTHEGDRTLVMVPLFHNTGFADQLGQMLAVGGAVDLLPAFGLSAAHAALVRRPSTYLIAVPGILRLLTESPDADAMLDACRIAAFGGSPMPEAWIRDMAARWPGLGLFNIYGLTEFTSISHCLAPRDLLGHADTVGRPVGGAEQMIAGPHGEPLAPGEAGEIRLAGASRMTGYWRDPERTDRALQGRWLVTGDIGSVDEDGFLRLLGRASEVINRGGEKVSPIQVEAAVTLEPGVDEAGVVGAPHPVFGERVVAFVTLRGADALDEHAARLRLLARVADYAVPERFFVLDEMPRTAAGKVDRLALRRHAETAFATAAPSSPIPQTGGATHGLAHP